MKRNLVQLFVFASLFPTSSLLAADKGGPQYVISAKSKPILTDYSGVTYRPERKAYFVIENRMGNVFELSPSRRILNMFPTRLAEDTEGVIYAGNGLFYVCGEVGNRIFELELKDGTFIKKRTSRSEPSRAWGRAFYGKPSLTDSPLRGSVLVFAVVGVASAV
jgi:hypothetical protein